MLNALVAPRPIGHAEAFAASAGVELNDKEIEIETAFRTPFVRDSGMPGAAVGLVNLATSWARRWAGEPRRAA